MYTQRNILRCWPPIKNYSLVSIWMDLHTGTYTHGAHLYKRHTTTEMSLFHLLSEKSSQIHTQLQVNHFLLSCFLRSGWIALCALPEHIYVECIQPVVWIHSNSTNRFTFILYIRPTSSPGHKWPVHCRCLDRIRKHILVYSWCLTMWWASCFLYPISSFCSLFSVSTLCSWVISFPCIIHDLLFSRPVFISVPLYSVAFSTLFLSGCLHPFVPSNLSFHLPS